MVERKGEGVNSMITMIVPPLFAIALCVVGTVIYLLIRNIDEWGK